MKKALFSLLVLLLLLPACAQPNDTGAAATPTGGDVAYPAATQSAPPTPPPRIPTPSPLPPEERLYYAAEETFVDLRGATLTEQDMHDILLLLRANAWEDLFDVLGIFGLYENGFVDIRRVDFQPRNSWDPYVTHIDEYYANTGYGGIHIQGDGAACLVVLRLEGGQYHPCTIIELLPGAGVSFLLAGELPVVCITGESGGTGMWQLSHTWYDCELGREVYTYASSSYDYDPYSSGIAMDWITNIDLTPAPTKEGFLLQARSSVTAAPYIGSNVADEEAEVYCADYGMYYDTRKRQFYTLYEERIAPYREMAQSKHEAIAKEGKRMLLQGFRGAPQPEMPTLAELTQAQYTPEGVTLLGLSSYECSRERVRELQIALLSRAGESPAALLAQHGIHFGTWEGDATPALLSGGWEGITAPSCTLDWQTSKERRMFLDFRFQAAGENRGLLILFNLNQRRSNYVATYAILYRHTGETLHIDAPAGLGVHNPGRLRIEIPVRKEHGHTRWESVDFSAVAHDNTVFYYASRYATESGTQYTAVFSPEPRHIQDSALWRAGGFHISQTEDYASVYNTELYMHNGAGGLYATDAELSALLAGELAARPDILGER